MSGHNFDASKEVPENSGTSPRPAAQQPTSQIANLIAGQVQGENPFNRTSFQNQAGPRQAVGARPIAPAPGPVQRTGIPIITTQSVPAQRILSIPASQHQTIVPKVQAGSGGAPIVSIAAGISIATTGTTSSTSTVIQGQGVASAFQMASLINRGSLPPVVHQSAIQSGNISQTSNSNPSAIVQGNPTPQPVSVATQPHALSSQVQTATPIIQTGAPIVPTFNTSHVPRGAVAASALSLPKSGQAPATVLRPPGHPANVQIPVTVSAGIVSVPLQSALQPRSVASIRPGTPPATTSKSAAHSVTQIEQRVAPGAMTGNPSTVQITIQQTRPTTEPVSRPIISQIQAPTRPVLQQTAIGASQKMISQAAAVNPILQPGNSPGITGPRLSGTGHSIPIGQTVGTRPKIVVAQNEKPPVIPGTIVTTTGKIGCTNISGQQFSRSKVQVMPAGSVSIAGIAPATQINMGSSRPALPIVSIPGNIPHSALAGVTTTTAASSAPSIPIAKVPPQRQVLSSAQSQSNQEVSRGDTVRPITSQVAQSASGNQGVQGATFLAQTQRGSPSSTQSSSAINVPTTQSDGRQDRQSVPFPYTIPAQDFGAYYNPVIAANYQNLLYQAQLTQNNVRPTIVPTQTSNLQATIQTGTGNAASGQNVRINHPMMVTVDPSRHTTLSVHAQYVSQADNKECGAPLNSTTTSIPPTSVHAGISAHSGPSPVPVTQPNASPRPSILRKRPNDGSITVVKKNLLTSITSTESIGDSLQQGNSPKSLTPQDPSRENSQSSTDTASSAESTPQSIPAADIKIKEEPPDPNDHASAVSGALALNSLSNIIEASPRKKPRKQSLHANMEQLHDGTSTDEDIERFSAKVNLKRELEKVAEEVKKEDLEEYVDEEGVRWTKDKKRPPVNLMNHYQCTWKTRNNHFQRYTDVKPKEERRPTVNELANQKSVHQKASGWKMYHLAAQLEEMMDQEKDVLSKISGFQENIAPKHISVKHSTMEDDIGMIHELTQGNIQRCQLVIDQLEEARSSMLKILNHKTRISEIITKHHSKRPVKKKERA